MNLLCMNVRGMGGPRTFRGLTNLVRSKSPMLIFLSETRMSAEEANVTRRKLGFNSGVAVASLGRSGGLLCGWHEDWDVEVASLSPNHIDLVIKKSFSATVWRFTGYYGIPETNKRRQGWQLLRELHEKMSLPWVIGGDFNEILHESEKDGGLPRARQLMEDFRQCLLDCQMEDLGSGRPKFTWKRVRHAEIILKERLDRFVANNEWQELFPEGVVEHEASSVSDHCPIFLHLKPRSRQRHNSGGFRFEKVWLSDDRVQDVVRDSWTLPVTTTTEKLHLCGQALKGWGRDVFGEVGKMVRKYQILLNKAVIEGQSDTEILFLEGELNRWLDREESYWSQRSRVQWLCDGDRNTRFFHQQASQRRKKNRIVRLQDDAGNTVVSPVEIKRVAKDYFMQLFTSENRQQPCDINIQPKVTDAMNAFLTSEFKENEVTDALKSMNPNKAPGPDGFSALFFQKFWGTVGRDVTHAALNMLNGRLDMEQWNKTNLVLIPKVKDPISMRDFRPISLCNVVYKLVSKCIANRLKSILPQVISANQSAFVAGRHILDNALIASECYHSLDNKRRGRRGLMAIKLDVSKAYDRVEWHFLEEIMEKMGFCNQWRALVMQCVKTVEFSILVNGETTESFKPSRGLRQGDPISPYLFLLCVEGFSALLQESESRGLLKGIKVCSRSPTISHLLFVDDSLIFSRATVAEATVIKGILDHYEALSGQKINLEKSVIRFSPCVSPLVRQAIKDAMGLQSSGRMDMYLGLPATMTRSKNELFRYIVNRVWNKSCSWKEKLLSKAGKEVMLKAVLQGIPVYVMGIFRLPRGTCEAITSILKKFWWGNDSRHRKIYWKSWPEVCKPKSFGGLGFRDIYDFNTALLAKQGWRLMQHPTSLVSQILKSKYFPHSHFLDAKLSGSPSYSWRSILSAKNLLLEGGRWRIGDGSSINVWGQAWLHNAPNGRLVGPPNIDQLHWKIKDVLLDGSRIWDLPKLAEVATEAEVNLISKLRIPVFAGDDKFCWPREKYGEYSVKSGYRLLREKYEISMERKSLWQKIWKCKVPPKVRIFAWRLLNGILPLRTSLFRRNIIPSNHCLTCGAEEETADHCFVWCRWARDVWAASGFPTDPTMLAGEDCLSRWFEQIAQIGPLEALENFLVVVWFMWSCRNMCVFQEKVILPTRVCKAALLVLQRFRQAVVSQTKTVQHNQQQSKWKPPEYDFIKVNCDGSLKDDGKAGVGGICRAHDGFVLGAFCAPVDLCLLAKEIEAHAIKESLLFARDCGFRKLVVESDAMEIVNEINRGQPSSALHGDIIMEIQSLQPTFESCSFHFVPRLCNSVADRLAMIGVYEPQPRYWLEETPACISDVILTDI